MEVIVKRSIRSYPQVAIDVKQINNVHWDNVSGGVNAKQAGYSLYGYIDYEYATELELTSGRHLDYNNGAKIMIPNSLNRKMPYREGYAYLLSRAGVKPHTRYNQSFSGKPCTTRTLEILRDGSKTRAEIRSILLSENYTSDQIRRALNRMDKDGRIEYAKKGNPQKQLVASLVR